MTENELKLFRLALSWYERWERCNPDVGMGPSRAMLLEDLIREVGILPSIQEKKRILQGC